jgi:hypothetical protein
MVMRIVDSSAWSRWFGDRPTAGSLGPRLAARNVSDESMRRRRLPACTETRLDCEKRSHSFNCNISREAEIQTQVA